MSPVYNFDDKGNMIMERQKNCTAPGLFPGETWKNTYATTGQINPFFFPKEAASVMAGNSRYKTYARWLAENLCILK